MKRLTTLPGQPTSYLDRYVAIRDKKHKKTKVPLTAAHDLVKKRYEDHAASIQNGSLAELKQDAEALKLSESLRACYNSSTQPLRELKGALRDAQPKRLLKYCPMCGTTLPRTWDHYMPAVKFPEFAVHPLNLVPCCATCNSIKDDDWLAGGKLQYLHAYLDDVPDLQFVHVELHQDPALAAVGATFSLQRPAGVADAMWDRIRSHFERLKLINRYDEGGNDEVAEILADCHEYLKSGGEQVRTFLSGCAQDRRAVYGRNHWIAVLMDAMAAHPSFEGWVNAA